MAVLRRLPPLRHNRRTGLTACTGILLTNEEIPMRKLILGAMAVLAAVAILSGASAGQQSISRAVDSQKSSSY